jgi:hypothetical protein
MSKQTTVRWLVSILNKEGFAPVLTDEEIQQALQMEREQIIDFCQMWEDSPLEKYDCKEDLFIELYGK